MESTQIWQLRRRGEGGTEGKIWGQLWALWLGQLGGWVAPESHIPWAAPVISAAAVRNNGHLSYQHPTSRTCWVPLLLCVLALEIPSTEIAQKCGRIYDLGREDSSWWINIPACCPLEGQIWDSWVSPWDRMSAANSHNQINSTPFIGLTSFPGFS